jgi:hypothetical protein
MPTTTNGIASRNQVRSMTSAALINGDIPQPRRDCRRRIVEPLLLLKGVRELAALACPAAPTAATQRAFDDARVRSPTYTHIPAARQIAAELRMQWRDVLALAHEPDARHAHALGLRGREWAPEGWLTAERVRFALRLVAGRRGAVTLTMGAYDAERDALLAEDRRDWLHGRRLRLPDAEAIRLASGDWDAALRLAGLEACARPPREVRQVILSPVVGDGQAMASAPTRTRAARTASRSAQGRARHKSP